MTKIGNYSLKNASIELIFGQYATYMIHKPFRGVARGAFGANVTRFSEPKSALFEPKSTKKCTLWAEKYPFAAKDKSKSFCPVA